jgi:hypothetical protein
VRGAGLSAHGDPDELELDRNESWGEQVSRRTDYLGER